MDKPFLPIDAVLIETIFSALVTIKKKKKCGKPVLPYLLSIKSHGIKHRTFVSSAAASGSRPLLPPASKRGHGSKLACTARDGEWPQTRGKRWVPGPSSPACFWLCSWLGEHERAAHSGKDESFAGSNHLLYILQGVCCGFTECLHGRLCPILLVCSAGSAGVAWSYRTVQKSSDLLVSSR